MEMLRGVILGCIMMITVWALCSDNPQAIYNTGYQAGVSYGEYTTLKGNNHE